jgi:hypothetical protein
VETQGEEGGKLLALARGVKIENWPMAEFFFTFYRLGFHDTWHAEFYDFRGKKTMLKVIRGSRFFTATAGRARGRGQNTALGGLN